MMIIDRQCYFYVDFEAALTVKSLDNVYQITTEACKVASEIYDAIDRITSGDEDETIVANDIYEELLDICSRIEKIRGLDTLIELSEFDSNEFIIQQLQDEYAMEAYEDNLEKNCIDSVSGEAMGRVWDLTQAAKEDVDALVSEIDKFCEKYSQFIENLRSREIKKISGKINNT